MELPSANIAPLFTVKEEVPKAERKSSYEEEIQAALVRLKEKCFPPSPTIRVGNTTFPGQYHARGAIHPYPYMSGPGNQGKKVEPFSGRPKSSDRDDWDLGKQSETVGLGRPLALGMVAAGGGTTLLPPWSLRQKAVEALKPEPKPINKSAWWR